MLRSLITGAKLLKLLFIVIPDRTTMSTQVSSLTYFEIDRRVAKAQSNNLDIDAVVTEAMKKVINANADAIGSPLEFIFFPLLSISAYFMGPNTRILVNEQWREPLILWTVVLADKGQKKSPALNRFVKPIQELEEEMKKQTGKRY